jgi:hypothetical protein
MDVTGTAVLGQTPIRLTWTENFTPKGFSRQFSIQATVDDAGRRSMGLDLGDHLQGPIGVNAVMTEFPNKANNLLLNADLTPGVLDIRELGWRKEAGTRGTLKAEIALTGDRPTAIRTFALDGEGFNATGAASFAADGKTVSSATLERLAFGRTDIGGDITRRADGGYDISLRGRSLDATPLLRGDRDQTAGLKPTVPAAEKPVVPLGIALTLQSLYLSEGGPLSHVSARMQRDSRHWRSIQIDGRPSEGRYFSLSLVPDRANRL